MSVLMGIGYWWVFGIDRYFGIGYWPVLGIDRYFWYWVLTGIIGIGYCRSLIYELWSLFDDQEPFDQVYSGQEQGRHEHNPIP